MDKPSSPDLLSDLPLSIIHNILSLVPIRDAIRTSLLSTQWRYIWASLPHLAFDRDCVTQTIEDEIDEKRLIHFISQALLLHEGPIHKFKILMPFVEETQCIYQWLLFLSRSNVRILVLETDCDFYEFGIHSRLYSCQNLTHLEIHQFSIPPPPPSFKGFLCLKSLYLYLVQVDSSTFESIVAHSPLLEELTLEASEYSNMTIHALNLKHLRFRSVDTLSLYTPLLQELTGCFEYTESFVVGVESSHEALVFRHLRTINLSYVPFDEKEVTPAVIRLIMGSPNLQKLEIQGCFSLDDDAPQLARASLWDIEPPLDFTYDSLKLIKMKYCAGEVHEMKLIKLLLARSPALETFIYKPYPDISDKKLLKLRTRLLKYHRASTNAQIVINR